MPSEDIRQILDGNIRAISRALTLVENGDAKAVPPLIKNLFQHSGNSLVIGITGGGGAGKSTIVDQLAQRLTSSGTKVGVIAVDPTSPFSGGAILGDRVRMRSLATDPLAFIRSMATRGQQGGLSSAVADALVILDAAGYKILIVETIGAGQDEIDIARTADVTIVVLVPGMGDDIQTIKAGIMEIGDIFVVNKADRDGADQTKAEVEALLSLSEDPGEWKPPVIKTAALQGKGIDEILDSVNRFHRTSAGRKRRRLLCLAARLREMIRDQLMNRLMDTTSEADLEKYAYRVLQREIDPYSAVEEILRRQKS